MMRIGLGIFALLAGAAGAAAAERTPSKLSAGDLGIYPELAQTVELLPAGLGTRVTVDLARGTLVVWQADDAIAVFGHTATLVPGGYRTGDVLDRLELSAGDARTLAALTVRGTPMAVHAGDPKKRPSAGDRDGDGIPDPLDVLIGARKLIANGASYIETYRTLSYPNGDVPRTEGVCTDTVVRSLRNAGLDLQRALYEDIAAAPRAYPMVKKRNRNIDHRRVKTLLPYFRRHLREVPASEPYLAGDVVFFDTFPSKAGPDHIGIVSDRVNDSGLPLVINNWTDGSKDAELDLLGWVPVTHRFRLAPR